MDELIIRSLQGLTTAEEEDTLARWCSSSHRNMLRYEAVVDLWSMTAATGPGPAVRALDIPDADDLIDQAEGGAVAALPDVVVTGRSGLRLSGWAGRVGVGAVAGCLVALGLGLGVLVLQDSRVGSGSLGESVITTGAGEMTTVDLGDGTSIRLGPRSKLRVDVEGNQRVAWLEGRAFFGISADRTRPFTVRTAYGEAMVFGTRFEVRAEDEELRVLVVDGVVQVSANGKAEELQGGEMSRSPAGAPPSRDPVEDVYSHLGWMGRTLVFQATPLTQAAREIERAYGVEFALEDPRLAEIAVTVTFTDEEVETVVLVLCEIVEARCSFEDGLARITGRSSALRVPVEER